MKVAKIGLFNGLLDAPQLRGQCPLHDQPLHPVAPQHGQAHSRPTLTRKRLVQLFLAQRSHVAPLDQNHLVTHAQPRPGGPKTLRHFAHVEMPVTIAPKLGAHGAVLGRASGDEKQCDTKKNNAARLNERRDGALIARLTSAASGA